MFVHAVFKVQPLRQKLLVHDEEIDVIALAPAVAIPTAVPTTTINPTTWVTIATTVSIIEIFSYLALVSLSPLLPAEDACMWVGGGLQ